MLLPHMLNSLASEDRSLFAQIRAGLRRDYLGALAHVAGADHYDETDDRILDALDIRVYSMFARGGRTRNVPLPDKNEPQGQANLPETGNVNEGNGTGVPAISNLDEVAMKAVQDEMAAALGETGTTSTVKPEQPWIKPTA
jgi:hypothetical protein